MKYRFYYDESEHSRKINYNTISASNYYDNFITVIVGWRSEHEKEVAQMYAAFEQKYADRESHGELKSKTIKQSQMQYGFASLNEANINLLDDFLSLINKNIFLYFSVTSKIEFIITQLFQNYHNSPFEDMDAMKYSIIKALLTYHPQGIMECIYNNTDELIDLLKTFFRKKIEQNNANLALKGKENDAFEQILILLDDVQAIKTIDWNYDVAFLGFGKYLQNKEINDYSLTVDKEGNNQTTANAARRMGLVNVEEKDSMDCFGVRIADMLVGLISKFLKAMYNSLHQKSLEGYLDKNLLDTQWFKVNSRQLELYKRLYHIISELNDDWDKSFSGIYADDLISFIALLEFMNHFEDVDEIKNNKIDMQGEYFNTYACECLSGYFKRMRNKLLRNKLPIEVILNDSKDYFLNQRGAKIFFDINRQPILRFVNGRCKSEVLSIGFSRECVPLATVTEDGEIKCYRLPEDLGEWAMTMVRLANMGTNMFPSEVVFSKHEGKCYADIL